jgi:hypothetical protein
MGMFCDDSAPCSVYPIFLALGVTSACFQAFLSAFSQANGCTSKATMALAKPVSCDLFAD